MKDAARALEGAARIRELRGRADRAKARVKKAQKARDIARSKVMQAMEALETAAMNVALECARFQRVQEALNEADADTFEGEG